MILEGHSHAARLNRILAVTSESGVNLMVRDFWQLE